MLFQFFVVVWVGSDRIGGLRFFTFRAERVGGFAGAVHRPLLDAALRVPGPGLIEPTLLLGLLLRPPNVL